MRKQSGTQKSWKHLKWKRKCDIYKERHYNDAQSQSLLTLQYNTLYTVIVILAIYYDEQIGKNNWNIFLFFIFIISVNIVFLIKRLFDYQAKHKHAINRLITNKTEEAASKRYMQNKVCNNQVIHFWYKLDDNLCYNEV